METNTPKNEEIEQNGMFSVTEEEMQQLRQIKSKYNSLTRKIRRALPFVAGMSAATAYLVPSLMKFNAERDAAIDKTLIEAMENIQQNHTAEMIENARNLFAGIDINKINASNSSYDFSLDYFPKSVRNALQELGKDNPELVQKLHQSMDGDEFARERGFADYQEYLGLLADKFPEIFPENWEASSTIPPETITMTPARLDEFLYYWQDFSAGMTEQALNRNAEELLTYGIDVSSIFDQPIGEEYVSGGFSFGSETTPRELLDAKSSSSFDMSHLTDLAQQDMAIGTVLAGAVAAAVTGIGVVAYENKDKVKEKATTAKDKIKSVFKKDDNKFER